VGRYPNLPIASLLPEPDLWQPVEVQIEEELPEEK
jgi:hypothetical protein